PAGARGDSPCSGGARSSLVLEGANSSSHSEAKSGKHSVGGTQLIQFAATIQQRVGDAATVLPWPAWDRELVPEDRNVTFSAAFVIAATKARQIHFSLKGVNNITGSFAFKPWLDGVKATLRAQKQKLSPDNVVNLGNPGNGNTTNFELY